METISESKLKERYEFAVKLWRGKKYIDLLEVVTENIAFARHLNCFHHFVENQKLQASAYYRLELYQKCYEKLAILLNDQDRIVQHFGIEYLCHLKHVAAINQRILGDLQGAYKLIIEVLNDSESQDLKTKAIISLSNVFQYMYQVSPKEIYLTNAINFLREKIESGSLDKEMLEFYKTSLGIVLLQKQELDEAESLLTEVLNTSSSDYVSTHAMDELAWLSIQRRNYLLADEYLKKSYEILKNGSDQIELARNSFLRGMWYKAQNQYEKAEYYLTESADILEEKQVLIQLLNVSYELFKIHERVNPTKATKYFITCEKIKEKIYTPKDV